MVHTSIPLADIDNGILNGEFFIPKTPRSLIVFAHGSGSGHASPRNQYVANILNENGFATFLVDLLTTDEQDSDIRTQKVMCKIPGLVLNKFNIRLLTKRLNEVTKWLLNNIVEVKDLPIGYFGSSTGAAAAIESSPYLILF